MAPRHQSKQTTAHLMPRKIEEFTTPENDWETHQFYMKYRDKLSRPMAGLDPRKRVAFTPGGLQRSASTQILSFGVSSSSSGVVFLYPYATLSHLFGAWHDVTLPENRQINHEHATQQTHTTATQVSKTPGTPQTYIGKGI